MFASLRQNNIEQYLKIFRYTLGICSSLLCILGVGFIIFMPPLWLVFPLFIYLILLNFRQPKRSLDQFDLTQINIWLIVVLPLEYFVSINFVLASFICYKIYKKQIINCYLMLGFCIVFMITKDFIALSILIILWLFSFLYDLLLDYKISSASQT